MAACVLMTCGVALYAFLTVLAAPEERGPHQIATLDAGEVSAAGEMIPLAVYYPTDLVAPGPLVAVVHGYVRNGSFMRVMAETLASHGLVAIVPDMPCTLLGGCDHDENGLQISGLMDWAIDQSANNMMSPIYGLVDSSKLGVIGHSWGGLGVFMSGLLDTRYQSVVTLDANDDRGLAAGNAPMFDRPSMHIMASVSGACNSTDWGDSVYPLTLSPHMRIRIVGAGHCDVEDPTDNFCPTFCNAGDPATTPLFRRYAVAFTTCQLMGLNAEYIGGAELDADVARGAVDNVDSAMIDLFNCRAGQPPPTDAGVPIIDDAGAPVNEDAGSIVMPPDAGDAPPPEDAGGASTLDAGEVIDSGEADANNVVDAGPASAADASSMTAGPAQADDGCRCVSRGDAPALWLLAPLLLLLCNNLKRDLALRRAARYPARGRKQCSCERNNSHISRSL